jgi:hypothetical protein
MRVVRIGQADGTFSSWSLDTPPADWTACAGSYILVYIRSDHENGEGVQER